MNLSRSKTGTVLYVATFLIIAIAACGVLIASYSSSKDIRRWTIPFLYKRADVLNQIKDPIRRDSICIPLSAFCRNLDQRLPLDTKIFLPGMLGKENGPKLGYHYFMQTYLYPRLIDVSVGDDLSYKEGYWVGSEPTSDEELLRLGYHLLVNFDQNGRSEFRALQQLPLMTYYDRARPNHGLFDPIIAFMVPVIVALFGMGVVWLVLRETYNDMRLGERFATGLAVGSYITGQGIFALRLMGFSAERIVFVLFACVALFFVSWIIWKERPGKDALLSAVRKWQIIFLIPLAAIFIVLFKLAGEEGMLEFDAVNAWVFKAKLLHLHAGKELFGLFSEPRFAYAHLDYPVIVPSLHAFTYGVIGHVNEFVTKLWPAWMLFALVWMLLSSGNFFKKDRGVFMAAIAIMFTHIPKMIEHVRAEGAVLPIMLFSVVGTIHMIIALLERDGDRLILGLFVLFAQMFVKNDGKVVVAALPLLLLLWPDFRKTLFSAERVKAIVVLICFLVLAMPYIIFKSNIELVHPEANWGGLLFSNPGRTFQVFPPLLMSMIAKRFVNNGFASWISNDGVDYAWNGHWNGLSSLISEHTWGIAWLCLLLLVSILVTCRKSRATAILTTLIFCGQVFASTLILSTWTRVHDNINQGFENTEALHYGRVIFPFMMTWFASLSILFFRMDTKAYEESKGGAT